MPGSGKTTLVEYLSKQLGIGHIAKDDIKELMGDQLGIPRDMEENRLYGKVATDALFAIAAGLIESDRVFIFESAFWTDIGLGRFRQMRLDRDVPLLQVYVFCEDEVRLRRFNERSVNGSRHTVHADLLYADESGLDEMKQRYRPMELEDSEMIRFDTTNPTEGDFEHLKKTIKDWIEKHA